MSLSQYAKSQSAELSQLPLSERPFERLPTKALWQMRLYSLLSVAVVCALLALLLFGVLPFVFLEGPIPWSVGQRLGVLLGFFTVLMLLNLWLTRLQYNYTGYRLDDDGLAIRQGILWRSETIALRSRVQHIDISRPPLSRALGLAKINVYTAGTKMGKISLDGLALADAQTIRDQLISHHADTL